MTQMGGPGYPHAMLMGQNGQPQYMGRPHQAMQFNPNAMTLDMMKARGPQQPGQPFQGTWQQMMNQSMNTVNSRILHLLIGSN
jgi:cytochrome c1